MNGNAVGLHILEKYPRIPSSSIRYVPDADVDIVRTIKNGVLFLMAFWSGPSMNAFIKLTKALHDMKAGDQELVVVDVDGSPNVCQLPKIKERFGGVAKSPAGCGEAAFCRNGQIVHAAIIGSGDDKNQYYFNAREFLSSSSLE